MNRMLLFQRKVIPSSAIKGHCHQHRRLRHYTDAALLWGKTNPQQAQSCLQPPPFPASSTSATTNTSSQNNNNNNTPNDWSAFWKWRNWNFSSLSSRKHEQALVSHVLTGPLTLAHANHNVQLWTCLGARTESMLPVPYWKEFLYYSNCNRKNNRDDDDEIIMTRHTTLSFVGPECDHVPSEQQLTWDDHSSLTLKWSFRGKYHDMPHDKDATPATSMSRRGFVLFNPGFAHPHLQKDWRPTLEKLWHTQSSSPRAFVLTAHSAADAERDWKLWHAFDSTIPNYQENPWASQITYQDPLDSTNITIRPNAYVCHPVLS